MTETSASRDRDVDNFLETRPRRDLGASRDRDDVETETTTLVREDLKMLNIRIEECIKKCSENIMKEMEDKIN